MSKITIENTKTPTIIKFVSDSILTEGSFEYNNIEEVDNSTLIQQLFHLPFVKKVFVTANFIAIERFNIVEWPDVQDDLKDLIEDYLIKNGTLFNEKNKTKSMPVQIYTESTPNPSVMKFVTNKLLTTQNIEILSIEQTEGVPLASALFNFSYIKEVFISENFISITRIEDTDWFLITNEVRSFLKKYLEEGKSVIDENYIPVISETKPIESVSVENLDDISKEIVAILDEYIKPAVTSDGGNIMFQSYDATSKVVNVVLQGACSGCPSSTITLKNGIEATLKQLLPNKIEEVVAING
ncbi:MAG TPA: hypothetical protein DDZ39_03895 [Flavobacteriaceae bacterium]|jgi:Fe-S cluster biogenesis protein NfuA|nr:hypothetical protein [Flavobacteriaceae bacterium]HBS12100.1 hypothetical protein [Flavobacteriaceae bacterium]